MAPCRKLIKLSTKYLILLIKFGIHINSHLKCLFFLFFGPKIYSQRAWEFFSLLQNPHIGSKSYLEKNPNKTRMNTHMHAHSSFVLFGYRRKIKWTHSKCIYCCGLPQLSSITKAEVLPASHWSLFKHQLLPITKLQRQTLYVLLLII